MNIYQVKWWYRVTRWVNAYGDISQKKTDRYAGETILTCRDEHYAQEAIKAMFPKVKKIKFSCRYLGPA